MTEHRITLELCREAGFTGAAYLDPAKLELMPEIRRMCEDNRCGRYNKCWACPPACGSLDELRERVLTYDYGVLLQVTGRLEDPFDIDAMHAAEKACNEALDRLEELARPLCRKIWPMTCSASASEP